MTDPHIGRLMYKPTARADVLKATRLPLSLKALLVRVRYKRAKDEDPENPPE